MLYFCVVLDLLLIIIIVIFILLSFILCIEPHFKVCYFISSCCIFFSLIDFMVLLAKLSMVSRKFLFGFSSLNNKLLQPKKNQW